jgi:hypothetical protein
MNRTWRSARLLSVGIALLAAACSSVLPPVSPPDGGPPVTCRIGFQPYVGGQMGFSSCFPALWEVTETEGTGDGGRGVLFSEPAGDDPAAAKQIAVLIAPGEPGQSDPDLLEGFVIELFNRRVQLGLEAGTIETMTIDGRPGAEDSRVRRNVISPASGEVAEWVAGLAADGELWTIHVSGPEASSNEIQSIYRQFLSALRLDM